ncbi:MAG: hypothetical protein H7Z71_03995 [Moraxellaceae bacterium]|nr:hypothetical protein [Pseudobdellovibrionaceae bacterium]
MSLTKRLRFHFYNMFDLASLEDKAISHQANYTDLPIVSLTTVPKRIQYLKPTLVSLLKQSIPPKEIQINLGEDFFTGTEIPEFLKNLKMVKIQWIEKDLGPATKYIPTLERYKNTNQLVVIVDDDMYYSDRLIKDLITAEKKSDGKKVFCVNGFKVPSDFQSASRPSDKAIKSGQQKVAVVEGCGGYTLRPGLVPVDQLIDLSQAPRRSHYDDDIWLSGHLSRAKIEKIQIVSGKRKSLVNTIESAISGDRAQLQTDLMEHFKSDWNSDEIQQLK